MPPSRDTIIARIAQEALGLETLEARRMDDLDFHDLTVWSIRQALERAYEAGRAAMPPTRTTCPACQRYQPGVC